MQISILWFFLNSQYHFDLNSTQIIDVKRVLVGHHFLTQHQGPPIFTRLPTEILSWKSAFITIRNIIIIIIFLFIV